MMNILPPAKINPAKLLPSASSRSLIPGGGEEEVSIKAKDLIVIKTKVIQVKDLIKTSTLLKQAEAERLRIAGEEDKAEKREEELEKKPDVKEDDENKFKLPNISKPGFFGRIEKFFTNILLGYAAVRLLPYVDKLPIVVGTIGGAIDFGTDMFINLFDKLATFVDWGYKAQDATVKFIKGFGGDSAVKAFEFFNGTVGNVITAAIAASMAISSLTGDDFYKGSAKGIGKALEKTAEREGKEVIEKSLLRGIVKKIPIIGGLIDFAIAVAMGDNPGKAAFRAIGATLLGGIGEALGGAVGLAGGPLALAGAALGGVAGGMLGDAAGAALYDTFFGNQTPQKPQVAKAAGGGPAPITRGGRLVGTPVTRTIQKQKSKRTLKIQPTSVKPGKSVGGADKLKTVFPGDPNKPTGDTANTVGYMKSSYDKFSGTPGFGGLAALFIKAQLGERPSDIDYQNAASGLEGWMQRTFSDEVLRTGGGFADGGEVNAGMFSGNGDMRNLIARSIQDSVAPKIDDTINDLMKQLGLKASEAKPGEVPGAAPTDGDVTGLQGNAKEFYDYLVSKGLSPNNAMGLALNAARETGFNYADQHIDTNGLPVGGVFQWNGPRFTNLQKEVPDWKTNWKGQLDYALRENNLSRQYITMKFNSPLDAANWWMREWERPANPALDEAKHKKIYDQWVAQGMKQGQGPPGGIANLGNVPGNLSVAQQLAASMGLTMTSFNTGRHAKGSLHYQNRAMDFSNGIDTPEQKAFANAIISKYGTSIAELIYTPLGFGIKNGKQVGLDYWGDAVNKQHHNHVHVAFGMGGRVSRPITALIGERGQEFVFDADTTRGLDNLAPGLLEHLNAAKTKPQLASILQSYAGYEDGGEQVVYVVSPEPQVVPMMMPVPIGGGMIGGGSGSVSSDYDSLYHGH